MKLLKDFLRSLGVTVTALLILLCLGITAVYVRSAEALSPTPSDTDLTGRYTDQINNALSSAVAELAYIPKIYRIPQGSAAPAPDPEGFGSTTDPAEVRAVIDRAKNVLGDQTIVGWSEDTVLWEGSSIRYYQDDSMVAILWDEVCNGNVTTFCEIKLSDASQLRRKLSGDRYGYGIQKYPSQLAAEDKAVVAINGDFYAFRTSGIRVWQETLYLVHGWDIDTCFFDKDGNMLFAHRGDITSWDAARSFIEENEVSFSLTFGPVLVENGENVTPWDYPIGEINELYSRSVIGQIDELHYLLAVTNVYPASVFAQTATQMAELMIDRGCHSAYALDGGQTATIHLNGKLVTSPVFGSERVVSDILCFASAVPEGGTP